MIAVCGHDFSFPSTETIYICEYYSTLTTMNLKPSEILETIKHKYLFDVGIDDDDNDYTYVYLNGYFFIFFPFEIHTF